MIEPRVDKASIPEEPDQFLQAATMHVGVIKDLKDPEGRGRVRVMVPSLLDDDDGEKNWTNWCEVSGFPLGSGKGKGDVGIWWSPSVGQKALVYFVGGDYFMLPFFLNGNAWNADGEEKKCCMVPAEAKVYSDVDPRMGTRIKLIKSESGATLGFDDNGQSEAVFLVDWAGQGLALLAPGKVADEKEKDNEESKWRKNDEVRGTKLVFNDTSKNPKEICEGGVAVMSLSDMNGSGISSWAEDGHGVVAIASGNKNGDQTCSIVMDSKNKCIMLTAGGTQFVIDGTKGHVETTKQIIQQQLKRDVKPFFQAIKAKMKIYFNRFKTYKEPEPGEASKDTDIWA
jgi:hypothetical protein